MEPRQYWHTYLDDHRAGASGGTALAKRILRSDRDTPWASQLEEVVKAITEDVITLDEVRTSVGASGGELKRVAARVAERVGRLKPNGHIASYSPLSRVLELETLMSALQGKQRLWVALRMAAPSHPELSAFDFVALEASGRRQSEMLGLVHEWAVEEMLGPQGD